MFLESIDPRGWQVTCSEERFTYLLSKHEESAEFFQVEHIKAAIEKPSHGCIFASAQIPNRHIYYMKLRGWKAELKVVVEFNVNSQTGKIVTFHMSSNRPNGEIMIWPPLE
jgi:hypothetical protein